MPGTTAQSSRLRSDLGDLVTLAERDLAVVWRSAATPAQAREALTDVLPKLVTVYGQAASSIAADWYDDLRRQSGVDRRFGAIVAEMPKDLGTTELARWGISPLYKKEPDWEAARALVDGGMMRRILNQSRATVMGSSIADPSARGWQRVGVGECAFCSLLISRGAVYSERTKDFAAHDNCRCSVQPSWGGLPSPVKPFTPSEKNIPQADKDRAKAWIADNL